MRRLMLIPFAALVLSSAANAAASLQDETASFLQNLANSDDPAVKGAALANLGWTADFGKQDRAEALSWYAKAAAAGSVGGAGRLAGDAIGNKPPADIVALFGDAAGKGDAAANNYYARCYSDLKCGWDHDEAKAQKEFMAAAAGGYARAMVWIGERFSDGTLPEKNGQKALDWLQKGAPGSRKAYIDIGYIYKQGKLVPQDYVKAASMFQRGTDLGNSEAMNHLALLYQDGNGVKKDIPTAIALWLRAIALDESNAMVNLAALLEDGKDVPKDTKQAMALYKQAADLDNSVGMNNLGFMYQNGNGVPADGTQAQQWYQKAVDAGSLVAISNLGDLYWDGLTTIQKNQPKACQYWKQAAANADFDVVYTFFKLGRCYETGIIGSPDRAQAIQWYRKGAAGGSDEAKQALKRLGQ